MVTARWYCQSTSTWSEVEDVAKQGRMLKLPNDFDTDQMRDLGAIKTALKAVELKEGGFKEDALRVASDHNVKLEDVFATDDDDDLDAAAVEDMDDILHEEFAEDSLRFPDQTPNDPRTFDGALEPYLSVPDLAHHLKQYEDVAHIPAGLINFTQPQYFGHQYPNARNIPFMSDKDPDKFRFDEQVRFLFVDKDSSITVVYSISMLLLCLWYCY